MLEIRFGCLVKDLTVTMEAGLTQKQKQQEIIERVRSRPLLDNIFNLIK